MSQLALSFLAGGLSAFSPCVLPTFPLLAGGALQAHRLGPVVLATGMVASFTSVALLLNSTGSFLGLDGEQIRIASAVLLLIFGILLLSQRLKSKTSGLTSAIATHANKLLQRWSPGGLKGQFVIGLVIGALWMPCTGPLLGAAFTMAAQGDDLVTSATMMGLFGIGASLPLLLVAYGAKKWIIGRPWVQTAQKHSQLVFGVILVAFGVLALTGGDKAFEAWLVNHLPDWLLALTTKY